MYGLSDRLKPLSAAEEQVLLALWELPRPGHPAGHQRTADRHRLGPGHGAQLFVPSGGKGWGQGRQGGEARTPICPRSPAGPIALRPCASGWTPCSAAACPKRSAPLPARAALPRASWNRPSGCWRSSIRRQKNMTCTIPMGDGKTKKLPLRELFVAFGRKMC